MLKPYNDPPVMKVYEAFGAIADERIRVKDNEAEVDSSQNTKTYKVIYDPKLNTIVASDSGTFWQRYVSYPSIALLLKKGVINYDKSVAAELKGIVWKDIADRYKHDYAAMEEYILGKIKDPRKVQAECTRILQEVVKLKLLQPEHMLRPEK
jgi:hypothetical protein